MEGAKDWDANLLDYVIREPFQTPAAPVVWKDKEGYLEKFEGVHYLAVEHMLNLTSIVSFGDFREKLTTTFASFEAAVPAEATRVGIKIEAETESTGIPRCKSGVWVMQFAMQTPGVISTALKAKIVYVGPRPSVDCQAVAVVDDASYSGGQLINALQHLCKHPTATFFGVVVPFMTYKALTSVIQAIKTCFKKGGVFIARHHRMASLVEALQKAAKKAEPGTAETDPDWMLDRLMEAVPVPPAMEDPHYYEDKPCVVFDHKMADFISIHTSVFGAGLYLGADGTAKSHGPLLFPEGVDVPGWRTSLQRLVEARYSTDADRARDGIDMVDVHPDIHPSIVPGKLDNHFPRPPYKAGTDCL